VRDEESARSAIPRIEDLTRKVDGLRAQADRLPEAARDRFHEAIGPKLSELETQTARLETVPGAEGIAPLLKDLVSDLRGAPPADVR